MPVLAISTQDDMKTLIENALNAAGITYEYYFFNGVHYFFFSGFATSRAYFLIQITTTYVYLKDCDAYTVETDVNGNITNITLTNARTIGYYNWGTGNAFYSDYGNFVFVAWYYNGYRYLVIDDVPCYDLNTRTVAGVNAFNILEPNAIYAATLRSMGGADVNGNLRLSHPILEYGGVYYATLYNLYQYNLNFGDIVYIDAQYYFCVDVGNLLVITASDTANNYVGYGIVINSLDVEIPQPSIFAEINVIALNDLDVEIPQPSIYAEIDPYFVAYGGGVVPPDLKAIYSKIEVVKG